jgi:hypothetical protein
MKKHENKQEARRKGDLIYCSMDSKGQFLFLAAAAQI